VSKMELESIGFYTLNDNRAKNATIDSPMWRCELIITETCNFKCPYCRGLPEYVYDKKSKCLSFASIKKIIDLWCKDKPLKNIRFSGGEPTLHPNIVDIVKYAKIKGIDRIAVSTNGSNKLSIYKQLVKEGVNDFSISLDACCAEMGDEMAGGIKGAWSTVITNIRELSKLTYVTVGVVYNKTNEAQIKDTIMLAHKLGVSDIRVIPSAQYNKPKHIQISKKVLDKHPILKYRLTNMNAGKNVRGLNSTDSNRCHLLLDDSIIAGKYHFPCVIYMREHGKPIGRVGKNMRKDRQKWLLKHNSYNDPICKKNCLDVCVAYNNKFSEFHDTRTE
jgi:molybdenum cofactor biosynthesis enzyme MoaA